MKTEDAIPDSPKEINALRVWTKTSNPEVQIEKVLQEIETLLAEAESDWQSGNEKRRLHSEEVFVNWAEYFLEPSGRRVLEMVRANPEKRPDFNEILFRCFWRASQTLLNNEHRIDAPVVEVEEQTDDCIIDFPDMEIVDPIAYDDDQIVDPLPKEAQHKINEWMMLALEPYCSQTQSERRMPANADTYPPILREAILFCCQNGEIMKRASLPFETWILIHLFGGRLLDKSALVWLVDCSVLDSYDSKRKWVSIAAGAKIPMALRKKADMVFIDTIGSSISKKECDEIAQLLWDAAQEGDAEAQCRQGEALLKDISLLEPDDYRLEIVKLLWETPQGCDEELQCSPNEAGLKDMLPRELQQGARQWFKKAAEQGHPRAILHLGKLLVEENPEKALEYFRKVAENSDMEAPRACAECEWGKLLLNSQESAKATRHLKAAAKHNNRAAMELLALDPRLLGILSDEDIRDCCHSLLELTDDDSPADKPLRCRVWVRLGHLEKDKLESAEWFRKAAEAGDGPGAYEWARCLLYGDGCDRDYSEAEKWLRKAWNILDGNSDLKAYASAWNGFLSALKEPQAAEVSITSEQAEKLRGEVNTEAADAGNG